jgi:hypothetical protein
MPSSGLLPRSGIGLTGCGRSAHPRRAVVLDGGDDLIRSFVCAEAHQDLIEHHVVADLDALDGAEALPLTMHLSTNPTTRREKSWDVAGATGSARVGGWIIR